MTEREPTDIERMVIAFDAVDASLPPEDAMLAAVRMLRDLLHGAGVHSGASAVANVIIAHERLCQNVDVDDDR